MERPHHPAFMFILPKAIYRVMRSPDPNGTFFVCGNRKSPPKIYMEYESQGNLNRQNSSE